MRRLVFALLLLGLLLPCRADEIEEWIENSPNPEELQRWLDDLAEAPLDLNRATQDELQALPFFDSFAARKMLDARHRMGGFRHLREALNTDGLTSSQRRSLEQFAVVSETTSRRVGIESRLLGGTRGEPLASHPEDWWVRYRGEIAREDGGYGHVFLGRQAEDREGFRQVSAVLSLTEERTGTRLGFGDFQLETGTGLVFASAYGMSNWLSSSEILTPGKPRGLSFRPSADRRSVFRGGAAEISRSHLQATLLGSVMRLDGATDDSGVLRITEGESYSSEQLADARRDQVEERLIGGRLAANGGSIAAGISGYHARYSPQFAPEQLDEDMPRLTGDDVSVASLFARASVAGASWVGEVARSQPGGMAAQTALSATTGRAALGVYHVFADADFYSPRSRVWGGFGEEAANQQNTGVRMRIGWPAHAFLFSAVSETTPFRTTTFPLKKNGGQIEMRWRGRPSAPIGLDLLTGRRWREEFSTTSGMREIRVDRARIDAALSLREEYRIRLEIRSATSDQETQHRLGTLLFFQAKTRLAGLVGVGRVTLFDLDGPDVATSVFENSLRGAYPLIPLSGTGRRAALMVSRRWTWGTTAAKIAHTHRTSDGERIGSLDFALEIGYEN